MKEPDYPADEAQRLAALADYRILDTAPEEDFDALARIAGHVLGTPIALVSLVDENRQWFKARLGLDAPETPRDVSFCGHAVAASRTLVVPDALADERFVDNPLVLDEPRVRFYAGAPLINAEGRCLGTLCAIDHEPRQPTREQLAVLEDLARQVVNQMELRRRVAETRASLASERQAKERVARYAACLTRLHRVTAEADRSLDDRLAALLEIGVDTLGLEGAAITDAAGGACRVRNAWPVDGAWQAGDAFALAETCVAKVLAADRVTGFPALGETLPESVCHQRFGLGAFIGAPLRNDDGQPTGCLSFAAGAPREQDFSDFEVMLVRIIRDWVAAELGRDVVQSALRERSLRDLVEAKLGSHAERASFFDAAHDMLVVGNFAGYFTELNPAAERVLGYTVEELKARPYTDFIHPDDVEKSVAAAESAVVAGTRSNFENRYRRRDGSYCWLLWSMTADRGRRAVYATARDITDQKRIERMKNEFISTVSHELRTPLTSIRGSLGLILGGAMGAMPEESVPLVEMACNNTDRLVRLINDMLDVDKIESGKMRLQTAPIELTALIRTAVAANESFGAQHEVSYRFRAPNEAAWVEGDADRLTQVLDNLLSNAAKYAHGTGEVIVELSRRSNAWQVTVVDRGPGIPESFRDQIFQRFSQADSSATKSAGGTGLGLNITRSIIEMHAGEIGFDSPPGSGASFWFRLAGVDAPDTVAATAPMLALPRSARVLIVEDDPDIAGLIALMLKQKHFASEIAGTAERAAELLAAGDYAAMTLDLNLPDESGAALYHRLHRELGDRMPPVIVVSANAEEGRAEINGDAVGIVDWIRKPIDQQRLLAAIGGAAGRSGRARVLHVEDDASLLAITRRQIAAVADVTEARSIQAARRCLADGEFDLAIVDLGLPDGHGRQIIEHIQGSGRPIPVVIYTGEDIDAPLDDLAAAVLVKTRNSAGDLLATISALVDRVT